MAVMAWSQFLVGMAYSLFVFRLAQQGSPGPSHDRSNALVVATVVCTALWGWFGLAFSFTANPLWLLFSNLLDLLRYGGWFAFLLTLLRPAPSSARSVRLPWLAVVAGALILLGVVSLLLASFGIGNLALVSQLRLVGVMATSIFALLLLEQDRKSVV